jgi:hypothetical protein
VLEYFNTYKAEVENQLEKKIKRIRVWLRWGVFFQWIWSFLFGEWNNSWIDTSIFASV